MFPLHLIVWGLHMLRDLIYKKFYVKEKTLSIGLVHENVVSDKEE
jgi:hypothetical protein